MKEPSPQSTPRHHVPALQETSTLTPMANSLILASPPLLRGTSDSSFARRKKIDRNLFSPDRKVNTGPKACKRSSPQEMDPPLVMKKRWKKLNRNPHSCKNDDVKPNETSDDDRVVTRRISRPLLDRSMPTPAKPVALDTRKVVLPTINCRKHPDLNVVTPATVRDLLEGEFDTQLDSFYLVDCRFLYEHKGGNIKGSLHLSRPDLVEEKFLKTPLHNSTRTAILFYCEFSANRAPKMIRHFRNLDRWIHSDTYPELFYPEIYLIDGGYKNCFETSKDELCHPPTYLTMHDASYENECKESFARLRQCWKQHTSPKCMALLQNCRQQQKKEFVLQELKEQEKERKTSRETPEQREETERKPIQRISSCE